MFLTTRCWLINVGGSLLDTVGECGVVYLGFSAYCLADS
jgi:hypothetical protein